ncbi:MAG TPA: hypothetical protein VGQ57_06445 [Polyangiaceae bacterium]|jgi:hypothetical protein|nr:hypothetical protein [Polyangiaceae bacterium]
MLKNSRRAIASSGALALVTAVGHSVLAAPSGAHPRLWLDSDTQKGIKAQAGVSGSPVARGAARCKAAHDDPSEYADGGWQGFEFVLTLSGCLASWEASGSSEDLETAIKYWNVLLDDYAEVGDAAGGDDVVTHDTGYAMRTFAPYSAIAYDWLHDAPGVTPALLAHARERFDAWVTYYTQDGYLRHMPGANYEAGYAFAATLIAIAEAGEAGSAGDTHWATVTDIWSKDLAPAFASGGVLRGGDWPEGWQYGPLSVTEHALAARALIDNGTDVPGASGWADSLVLRFAYGLTPVTKQAYAAGDSDNDTPNRDPENGALVGVIAGPGSENAKALARKLNADLDLKNENALFDALAAAKSGPSSALPADLPKNYLAEATGNWYLRGNLTDQTAWGVFQCARRLVDDHQHNDAGNWVLTRAADDVVVDPSPYGTLSTLTGNAPAVDSDSVPSGYSPSQANWGKTTGLRWARQSGSGVAAARCDYADQFRYDSTPSDVAVALRDFVLVPDGDSGEVVLVDRVVTGEASRGLHLRVRSPGDLSLASNRATAAVGASSLAIEKVYSSSGTPNVREMPQGSECPSSDHSCDVSRIPAGSEYRIDVSGPEAMAIHVVAARGGNDAAGAHAQLQGDGYRGVVVTRAAGPVAVVASDSPDGVMPSTLSYKAPSNALHVVVDAPVGDGGKSEVTATKDGSDCAVQVKPHAGSSGGFDGAPLVVRLDAGCVVSDDGSQMQADPGMNPAAGMNGGAGDGEGTLAGGAPSEAQGGQASDSSGKHPTHGASGSAAVSSNGTGGGAASLGTGGTVAASGGSASASVAGTPGVASTPPSAPDLTTCSVSGQGRSGGSSPALATAALGFVFFSRKRRAQPARR